MKKLIFLLRWMTMTVLATALFSPSITNAQNAIVQPYEQSAAYNDFNAAFLVQSGSVAYYGNSTSDLSQAFLWGDASEIYIVEDEYADTHSPATLTLLTNLLNQFLSNNGTDWSWDSWDDDMEWSIIACVRGYEDTGNVAYLDAAENNWATVWNRGWDDVDGGGIWENMTKYSKCALSNDPFIIAGCALYRITGNTTYLTESEEDYRWVRTSIFNSTNSTNALGGPGQVDEALTNVGALQFSTNVYNSGTFLEAADCLYQITGNSQYYNDAVLDMNFVINGGTNPGPIMYFNGQPGNPQYQYWFVKGMSDFCTFNNQWPTYYAYLLGNADTSWNNRNTMGLEEDDWIAPETNPDPVALDASSAAGIWQELDVPQEYQIINEYSGLAMELVGGNEANGASIEQDTATPGDQAQLWQIVPTPDGNYAIVSGLTDSAVAINGSSTAENAALVDQPYAEGNTALEFRLNAEGTLNGNSLFQFQNVNSGYLLSDKSQFAVPLTPITQWASDGLDNQTWELVPVEAYGGIYTLQNASSSKYLDVSGGSTADGASVVQDRFAGNTSQYWTLTPTSMGYYQIVNANSGQDLGIVGSSFFTGSDIDQSAGGDKPSNQWMPVLNGNGTYTFYNLNSGLVLEDPGSSSQVGIQYNQGTVNGNSNQQFYLSATPTFWVSAPSSFSVTPTSSRTITVSLNIVNGFAGTVALTASGLPTGVTASFSPASIAGSETSTLTLTASPTTALGSTTITITGTSESLVQSTTVLLTVEPQVFTSVTLAPSTASVVSGRTQQFTAIAEDQFGSPLEIQPTFSYTVSGGGTIGSSSGLFTASVAGGPYTVTATSESISGTATVTVQSFAVVPSVSSLNVHVNSSAASTISLNDIEGFSGAVALTVSGLPSGMSASFSPTSIAGSSTSLLTVAAGPAASLGTSTITVTGTSGTLVKTVQLSVDVLYAQVLTSVVVAPSTAAVVSGSAQQFSATGKDQDGSPLVNQPNFTWATSGGGTIGTSSGLFAATTPGGPYTVTATSGAIHGSASVTVQSFSLAAAPSTLSVNQGATGSATVSLSPISGFSEPAVLAVSGLPSGVTAQFTPVSAAPGAPSKVVFTVGPLATVGTATVTITGTYGNLVKTTTVSLTVVLHSVLTSITVSPGTLTLLSGKSYQFTAVGIDQYGDVMAVQPKFTWTTSGGGGIVATLGLFAATTGGGPYTITATSGNVTGTATVTVQSFVVIAGSNAVVVAAATPGALTLTGADGISLYSYGGFTGTVALKVIGVPVGVTASLSQSSISPFGGSTLSFTASAMTTTPSNTTITIQGTSGSLVKNVQVTLEVQ